MNGILLATLLAIASPCAAQTTNPLDALDPTKVGIAARFVTIASGTFTEVGFALLGRTFDNEYYTVSLNESYEIQATHVTQLQYYLVTDHSPFEVSRLYFEFDKNPNPAAAFDAGICDPGSLQIVGPTALCGDHPADNVSWLDAQNFVAKLNKLQSEYTYRLPTEAEWERAARGGAPISQPYWFDPTKDSQTNYFWYSHNSGGRPHAVAQKKPNPYGLYDMYGNVWQWIGVRYEVLLSVPDTHSQPGERVARGGSWGSGAYQVGATARGYASSAQPRGGGFRLARTKR